MYVYLTLFTLNMVNQVKGYVIQKLNISFNAREIIYQIKLFSNKNRATMKIVVKRVIPHYVSYPSTLKLQN